MYAKVVVDGVECIAVDRFGLGDLSRDVIGRVFSSLSVGWFSVSLIGAYAGNRTPETVECVYQHAQGSRTALIVGEARDGTRIVIGVLDVSKLRVYVDGEEYRVEEGSAVTVQDAKIVQLSMVDRSLMIAVETG